MQMHPGTRHYVTWPLTGVPTESTVEIRFDGGTWQTLERVNDTSARVMIAGPEVTSTHPAGTIVLTAGRHMWDVRVSDNPEEIVDSGVINVSR